MLKTLADQFKECFDKNDIIMAMELFEKTSLMPSNIHQKSSLTLLMVLPSVTTYKETIHEKLL